MIAALVEACAAAGFDLHATAAVADYNVRVPDDLRLPDLGRPRALVVVVGNTRALWPRFVAALAADATLAAAADPLDRYTEHALTAIAARTVPARHEVRFAHEAPPRRFAIQRLAEVAGLAAVSPSHLSVHPVYGPWIALRAALVVDVDGPLPRPPPRLPCACAVGCQAAFDAALAAGPPRDGAELRTRWRAWLAVRDACPVGRGHRYDDIQCSYHYTGDRATLADVPIPR
ncbi:MAG: hypothetical protein R3B06_24070 [Kofleriaceae bacterium]